jgi:hypothetical protein
MSLSGGVQPGGHVGFVAFNKTGEYWSEKRAMAFLTKNSQHMVACQSHRWHIWLFYENIFSSATACREPITELILPKAY